MGAIVFWTIIRTAILIPVLWVLRGYVDNMLWWSISPLAIYGVILHPAIIHYKLFIESTKEIVENTLCSGCKHFDKSAVLCMKYDKHPSREFLPCDGMDWTPGSIDANEKEIYNG